MPPLGIVQRACLERWGPGWIKPGHVVTGGPFRLAERRVRDRMRLVRHDGYWGRDEVALRTIDAYAAEGNTTQLNMYLTGQVDWMVKPPTSLYDVILRRPDVSTGPQAGVTFFRFNVTRPPLDDPRVRAALTLALDRAMLARDVMRGGELPAGSYVPAGLPGYAPAPLPPADPARARALLAEAGYPGGRGFPSIELLYPHNETTRDFCEAAAAQWERELGLRPRLVNQAWKVFLDSSRQLRYEVGWGAWTADYLDATSFLDIFRTGSGNNRTGWASADYDRLLDRAALAQDPAARGALLAEAEAVLLAELPVAPVYQRINLNLVAPRVRGFHDNALDVHPLRDLSVTGPPP
jgi:oligopeptide transport system substrate-binding protein